VTTGCVPSLHPLFTAEDLVFDRQLEGTWGILIGAHCFFKVSIEPDVLRLAPLNLDWVEHMIAEKKVNIAYQTLDTGGLILIASTKELQALRPWKTPDFSRKPNSTGGKEHTNRLDHADSRI
jgi:hypothetical protein